MKGILFILMVNFSYAKVIKRTSKILQNNIWTDPNVANDVTKYNNKDCHVSNDENVMDKIYHINTCRGAIDSEMVEFDMKKLPEDHARKRRAALFDEKYEWAKSNDGMVYIPYLIGAKVTQEIKTYIQLAILDFNQKTCIRFIPRRSNEKDFVYMFSSSSGCWSQVGKKGGRNDVSLDAICNNKGIVIHELMHVLGFGHEQSRRDRDRYVNIHWDQVKLEHRLQFSMDSYGDKVIYGTDYDEGSVMHYGNTIGGKTPSSITMTSKQNPSNKLGQRIGFSILDLREINLKYKCGRNYVAHD